MTSPENSFKRISMVLQEHQAPGLVEFLDRLPGRMESAFIRGLLYQWMLANKDTPDFEQRLAQVVDGPGGRTVVATAGVHLTPAAPRRPGPKPGSRRRDRAPEATAQQAQIVMPVVDAPRQAVREQAAYQVAPAGAPLPPPVTAAPVPTPSEPTAALPAVIAPAPAPASDDSTQPVDQRPADQEDFAALVALDNMF